jgi:hypothetical protein
VSLIDDSGSDDNTTFTDWSYDHDVPSFLMLSSDDYQIPEEDISCNSLVDEFQIFCSPSVDHSYNSSWKLLSQGMWLKIFWCLHLNNTSSPS